MHLFPLDSLFMSALKISTSHKETPQPLNGLR